MPRLKHEPWCNVHENDEVDGGRCSSVGLDFGPIIEAEGWDRHKLGGVSATRLGDGPVEVYIDYRTQGGLMDAIALRSVREAVAESPEEFLAALDALIELLGDAVPEAYRKQEKAAAS